MQEQDRIWTLVARKLAGEASREERKELEQLLHKYPDMTYTVEMLLNLWAQEKPPDNEEAEEAFERLLQRMAVKEAQKNSASACFHHRRAGYLEKNLSKANRLFNSLMNSGGMLNNYFKTSTRTLLRNKTFSAINIIGLAVALAGVILLLLWIQHIYSFDQFHTKKDRIYQVLSRDRSAGRVEVWDATPHPLGPGLQGRLAAGGRSCAYELGRCVYSEEGRYTIANGWIPDGSGFLLPFRFPPAQRRSTYRLEQSTFHCAHRKNGYQAFRK